NRTRGLTHTRSVPYFDRIWSNWNSTTAVVQSDWSVCPTYDSCVDEPGPCAMATTLFLKIIQITTAVEHNT
ncbi:hypothetical protein GBAR_LOCUS26976, partial [Geodia barretti]